MMSSLVVSFVGFRFGITTFIIVSLAFSSSSESFLISNLTSTITDSLESDTYIFPVIDPFSTTVALILLKGSPSPLPNLIDIFSS